MRDLTKLMMVVKSFCVFLSILLLFLISHTSVFSFGTGPISKYQNFELLSFSVWILFYRMIKSWKRRKFRRFLFKKKEKKSLNTFQIHFSYFNVWAYICDTSIHTQAYGIPNEEWGDAIYKFVRFSIFLGGSSSIWSSVS